jgi:hypothetical protein
VRVRKIINQCENVLKCQFKAALVVHSWVGGLLGLGDALRDPVGQLIGLDLG